VGGAEAEDDSSTYNAQLGTEYVHSPSTGENFLVDPNTSYNETGPQGPGYYQGVGTDYEKLELGRADE
jgi:hypothetical protein